MKNIITLLIWEIKILLKDKQALGVLFLMPAILILFLSFALTDVYHQKVGKKITVTVLTDESSNATEVITSFSKFNYRVIHETNHKGIQDYIHSRQYDVVIEIPSSLNKVILGKETGDKIKMSYRSSLDRAYFELVKSHFTIALQSMVLNQVNRRMKSEAIKDAHKNEIKLKNLSNQNSFIEHIGKRNNIIPNPIQQSVPAWAIFAMFFIVLPLSNSIIRDRENGVLKKLLSLNVKKAEILLGKLLPFFLINCLQFALMFGIGEFIVPLFTSKDFSLGNVNSSLILITLITALVSTSFGLLVSTISRTSNQATTFGPLAIVIMALLGGVMIPHFVMPEMMQKLSYLSPLYWAMDSYLNILLSQNSLYEISQNLIVLSVFCLGAFLISIYKFKWSQ